MSTPELLNKCIAEVSKISNTTPKGYKDLRLLLEKKDLDAVVIATPDHWHAPAALLAMKADKHVYLEKPCSHSPEEGEILVRAAQKYNKVVQMGNQRRSWPNVVEAINEIKAGTIGNVFFGKSWYTNNRAPIGTGEKAPSLTGLTGSYGKDLLHVPLTEIISSIITGTGFGNGGPEKP